MKMSEPELSSETNIWKLKWHPMMDGCINKRGLSFYLWHSSISGQYINRDSTLPEELQEQN